jgi:hypothetical protein
MLDRSLPDLEVVVESSLMSILRWNFKTNMEKTICSSENAQIILVRFFFFFLLEPEFIFIIYFQHMDSDLQSSESLSFFLPSSEN